jgi:hypothetical protein
MNTMSQNSRGRGVPTIRRSITFPLSEWDAFVLFVESLIVDDGRLRPVSYSRSEAVTAAVRLLRTLAQRKSDVCERGSYMNNMRQNSKGEAVPTTKRNLVFPRAEWDAFAEFVGSLTVGQGRARPVKYSLSETVTAAVRLMRALGPSVARETIEAYAREDWDYFEGISDDLGRGPQRGPRRGR